MTTLLFFVFLYLVVTETRLDDDLVLFCFKKQQGRHPILFQSLLDIKNKKQQGRHPILFQSLLDIKKQKTTRPSSNLVSVTETRLDDDLVVFLYLVVTETRLDDDLVVLYI
jgi:hypothetical protein